MLLECHPLCVSRYDLSEQQKCRDEERPFHMSPATNLVSSLMSTNPGDGVGPKKKIVNVTYHVGQIFQGFLTHHPNCCCNDITIPFSFCTLFQASVYASIHTHIHTPQCICVSGNM